MNNATDAITDKQRAMYSKYNALQIKEKLLLHEKLIFSQFYKRSHEDESRNAGFEHFYNTKIGSAQSLDLAQKYEVVRRELENANSKWELFEKNKDDFTDELLARNQEIINNIKDIKLEVYDLNRKIDNSEENKKGKVSAELFEKFFKDKKTKQNNLIAKLTKDNGEQEREKKKTIAKLNKKEKGTELEFIDFHQLQIENKKYIKDVDEKNKYLLKQKVNIGRISQAKNQVKSSLKQIEDNLTKANGEIAKKKMELKNLEKRKRDYEESDKKLDSKIKTLSEKQKQAQVKIEIDHHIKEKTIEENLMRILQTIRRKLKVLEAGNSYDEREVKETNDEDILLA